MQLDYVKPLKCKPTAANNALPQTSGNLSNNFVQLILFFIRYISMIR